MRSNLFLKNQDNFTDFIKKLPFAPFFPGNVNFVVAPFGSFGEGCGEVFELAVELFELDLVD